MLEEGAGWRRERAGGGSRLEEGAGWRREPAGGGGRLAEGASQFLQFSGTLKNRTVHLRVLQIF